MSTELGVFAKYWQAGAVKTRLAKVIGAETASQLYQRFVATTLDRFRTTADRRCLCYSPVQRRMEFAELAGAEWELSEQSSGDLGERMQAHFRGSLRVAPAGAVLIGTDSPTLPVEFVESAFELLSRENQVVLGPCDDGGYYLIGIRGAVPDIFARIRWSTSEVLSQTLAALENTGVSYALLPNWFDIDEVGDLRRMADDLNAQKTVDGQLSDLRTMINAVLGD